MQSISNALNRLHEDTSWFVRTKDVKLLVVRTSGDLWTTVVQLLPKFEFDRDNTSPWLLLEDAHTATEGNWRVRAQRLQEHWELRRKLFLDREKIEMPAALPQSEEPTSAPGAPPPLVGFESTLAGVLKAQRAPLDGAFVVVLAPAVLENVEGFQTSLWALMRSPSLERARWVVVLDEANAVPSIVDRMDGRAVLCECIIDPSQQQRDFVALTGARKLGRAGPPGVAPPPRVDGPPTLAREVREAALRAAGVNPAYLEQAPVLAKLLFEAAISMKEGRGKDAIAAQRRACDLTASLAMHEVHAFCRIALASYLSGLNRRDAAVLELRSTVEHAARYQLGIVEAQARLALGLLFAVDQRYLEAAHEYGECARRAEQANAPLIAIEGWRLAGQIALQLGDDPHAAACFCEAIRIAEGSDVDVARTSSAPDAARALAKRYDDKGLPAQAESLFQQADAIEQGEVGLPKAAAESGALSHARE